MKEMHNIQLIGSRNTETAIEEKGVLKCRFLLPSFGGGVWDVVGWFVKNQESLTHFLHENTITVPSILSTMYRYTLGGLSSVTFL